MRLDCFISNEFKDISRQKAIELIKQRQVSINDNIITKPSYKVSLGDNVVIEKDFFIESSIFCSRAALKLQRFLLHRDSKSFIFSFCNSKLFDKQTTFTRYIEHYIGRDKWLQYNEVTQKSNHTKYKNDSSNIQALVKKTICEMIEDSIVLDVGASAGGFTQVLLTHKPKLVIAQDVGNLQLDSSLRKRCDVLSIENVDIRIFSKNFCNYLSLIEKKAKISKDCNTNQVIQFLVCDVSFISLENILQSLLDLSQSMLLLYKPQYEVGLHVKRNKKGVVQDKKAIMQGLESFIKLLKDMQAKYIFVEKSLLKGKEGNEEFFIFCQF